MFYEDMDIILLLYADRKTASYHELKHWLSHWMGMQTLLQQSHVNSRKCVWAINNQKSKDGYSAPNSLRWMNEERNWMSLCELFKCRMVMTSLKFEYQQCWVRMHTTHIISFSKIVYFTHNDDHVNLTFSSY